MIFVTVGAQMPFDRLIQAVDAWAEAARRGDVFAQIGPSRLKPRNIDWTSFLAPEDFRRKVEQSTAIVAHAGIGSILTALELEKPIIVMPRRYDLLETRNDHQLATVRQFESFQGVTVALDEAELQQKLLEVDMLKGGPAIERRASPRIIAAIRAFITSNGVNLSNGANLSKGSANCTPAAE